MGSVCNQIYNNVYGERENDQARLRDCRGSLKQLGNSGVMVLSKRQLGPVRLLGRSAYCIIDRCNLQRSSDGIAVTV